MTVKEAIELLLDRINTRKQFAAGGFGVFEGTAGMMALQQRDANEAITLWQEKRDPSGLKQVAAMLHAYGNLTNAEYEQVMGALDDKAGTP